MYPRSVCWEVKTSGHVSNRSCTTCSVCAGLMEQHRRYCWIQLRPTTPLTVYVVAADSLDRSNTEWFDILNPIVRTIRLSLALWNKDFKARLVTTEPNKSHEVVIAQGIQIETPPAGKVMPTDIILAIVTCSVATMVKLSREYLAKIIPNSAGIIMVRTLSPA